ncbi:MAG: L-histidine N(alpha)-methyltransferase [Acidobacteriota bacterium]
MSSRDSGAKNRFEIFHGDHKDQWSQVEPSIWALAGDESRGDIQQSLLTTLWDQPRRLEPQLLYDERGAELFEQISALPEYYLTRTEEALLAEKAERVISTASVDCIVELGAGFSKKTRHLLREQVSQRKEAAFAAIDVSLSSLVGSRDSIQEEFPEIDFHGLLTRYEEGMSCIDKSLPTLFAFLGSSVGNFDRFEFVRFFQLVRRCMGSQDFFLLGVDCDKDPEVIEKAYNDSQGVTEAFILNVFNHVNRLVGSNFDVGRIRYQSFYDPEWRQVEMYGVSTVRQVIEIPAHQSRWVWEEGQKILVEVSRKFDAAQLEQQLQYLGFEPVVRFDDPRKWFSLLLFKKGTP